MNRIQCKTSEHLFYQIARHITSLAIIAAKYADSDNVILTFIPWGKDSSRKRVTCCTLDLNDSTTIEQLMTVVSAVLEPVFHKGREPELYLCLGFTENNDYLTTLNSNRLNPVCRYRYREVSFEPLINVANLGLKKKYSLYFNKALNHVFDQAVDKTLNTLTLMPDTEMKIVLDMSCGQEAFVEWRSTLIERIRNSITKHDKNIAYIYEGQKITYAQLDKKSDTLAYNLQKLGVKKNDIVFVHIDNSLYLPIAYIGCMKIGAVFTPIDTKWPEKRLHSLVKNILPKVVIANGKCPLFKNTSVLNLRDINFETHHKVALIYPKPDDILYGFFTSGSTGLPKCTLNKQDGIVNRFVYMDRKFKLQQEKDVILQNSSPVFDSSLWQLLWPILSGCTVIIPKRKKIVDLNYTLELMNQHKVTMTDFVPSIFNLMVEKIIANPSNSQKLKHLKYLLVGGEASKIDSIYRFYEVCPWVMLINTYGHTENSIGMVFYHIPKERLHDEIPIGKPIDNTYVMILDHNKTPLPPGAIGEIYVGGVCLGAGYYRDRERTDAAFVSNPLPQTGDEILYRTGDFGYLSNEGLLFYKGRQDDQIKIGGIRIDLGEIETIVKRFSGVQDAKVVFDHHRSALAAFVKVSATEDVNMERLKKHLKSQLPSCSLPGKIERVERFPLSTNGKLDKKTLLRQLSGDTQKLIVREDIRKEIVALWRQTLDCDRIGWNDDFFELGGSSFTALNLLAKLEAIFRVSIKIEEVYDNFTIKQLIKTIRRGLGGPSENQTVDWDVKGIAIKDYLNISKMISEIKSEIKVVSKNDAVKSGLLTGATGFLGSHLLNDLIINTDLKIYCFVRATDMKHAREKLIRTFQYYRLPLKHQLNERIIPVQGDLSLHHFGLSDDQFSSLGKNLDVIIHNGANVDFIKGYTSLRGTNIEGLKNILLLACYKKMKPIHFISSLSVFSDKLYDYYGLIPDKIIYDYNYFPEDGYSQSKWLSEHILTAARDIGVPVSIYRFGEIAPSSKTGISNQKSLLNLLLKSILYLNCYPVSNHTLDYLPCDIASRMIVERLFKNSGGRDFNIINKNFITINNWVRCLNRQGFYPIPSSYNEFMQILKNAIEANNSAAFLSTLYYLLPKPKSSCIIQDPLSEVFSNKLNQVDAQNIQRESDFPEVCFDGIPQYIRELKVDFKLSGDPKRKRVTL